MKFTKNYRRKKKHTGHTAAYTEQLKKQYYELSAGKTDTEKELLKKALSISLNP